MTDEVEVAEKGFEFEVLDEKVELKRLLPRFGSDCSCLAAFIDFLSLSSDPSTFLDAAFDILTPLMALTAPSFLRQAFLLQLKI